MEGLKFETKDDEINHFKFLSEEYKMRLDTLTSKVRSILDDYDSDSLDTVTLKRVSSDLSRMRMLAGSTLLEKSHAQVGTSDDDRTKIYPDDYLVSSRFQNKTIILGKNFICSALRNLSNIHEMRIFDGHGHHIIHDVEQQAQEIQTLTKLTLDYGYLDTKETSALLALMPPLKDVEVIIRKFCNPSPKDKYNRMDQLVGRLSAIKTIRTLKLVVPYRQLAMSGFFNFENLVELYIDTLSHEGEDGKCDPSSANFTDAAAHNWIQQTIDFNAVTLTKMTLFCTYPKGFYLSRRGLDGIDITTNETEAQIAYSIHCDHNKDLKRALDGSREPLTFL